MKKIFMNQEIRLTNNLEIFQALYRIGGIQSVKKGLRKISNIYWRAAIIQELKKQGVEI